MNKEKVLKKYFGYSSFRLGQEQIIDQILAHNDVLGVMPTGAGKSLCFQIPALVMDGITIVVSPLISLMRDQVQSLVAGGVAAAYINSTLSYNNTKKVIENAKNGDYKIIYVAPERLDMIEFIDFAMHAPIDMVTIDEAHCVSQWGQNFRPSYLKINDFIEKLPYEPIISAFTATATMEVKADIIKILKLKTPFIMATGFNRENLYFEVQKPRDKYEALIKYLSENKDRTGIIYCSTRKTVEEVCERLVNDKYLATRYHAGLGDNERTANQDDFLYDRQTIMVATNAFGMGIDKSNVGFVIHYNMPKNIESYYQEAGRAGRDGTAADCILLYGGKDVVTCEFLIDNGSDQNDLDPEILEQVKEKDRERLKRMTYYCHNLDCLREYILKYFGDTASATCGNCSNCNTIFEEMDITVPAQKIISCIARMNERYGIKMLIDTLRGSRVDKIMRLRLNELTTYGIMKDISEKKIRDMINYLVLNEYIALTNTEYPVAKLTIKSSNLLKGNEQILMKMTKDIEEVSKITTKSTKSKKKAVQLKDEELFAKLKILRLELAKRYNVPAFIIFSDATLIDMCNKLPKSEKEMLEVLGVGQMKLERYGDDFLTVIENNI